MVTSRDVALKAGVSQATVSRVMRGTSNVSPEMVSHVRKVADSVGYVPHGAARAMKTGRSGNIGVVVDELSNPFYPELLQALDFEARNVGVRLIVWLAGSTANPAAVRAMRSGEVDGLLFTTATLASEDLAVALSEARPVILINRSVDGLECDQVATDNFSGGAKAASHLLEMGHRNLAFVGGPREASTSSDRLSGFRSTLQAAGVDLDEDHVFHGEYSHPAGRATFHHLREHSPETTAVFCANDLLAAGVIDGYREQRTESERSLAVVGFDDVGLASWPTYSLTTVRQDTLAMARWAVRRLLERRHHPAMEYARELFPAELVVRASSRGITHDV